MCNSVTESSDFCDSIFPLLSSFLFPSTYHSLVLRSSSYCKCSWFAIQIPGKYLKSGHVFSAERADPKTKVGTLSESQASMCSTPMVSAMVSFSPITHQVPLIDACIALI